MKNTDCPSSLERAAVVCEQLAEEYPEHAFILFTAANRIRDMVGKERE